MIFEKEEYKRFGNPNEINNRFFVCKEKNFIYCEVPKTAITTVKKTLAEYLGDKVDYNVHDRNRYILKTPKELELSEEDFKKMYKFSFVRNPYTRVLSAYFDKIKRDTPEKKHIYNLAGLDDKKDLSFTEFLEVLREIPYKKVSPHFKPQNIMLCYPLIRYDFLGKFETFENDFKYILKKFFGKSDKIYTVDHHKTKATDKEVIKQMYSDKKAISLVQEIYGEDFLYFNYPLDVEILF